jgi:hypothetical protein
MRYKQKEGKMLKKLLLVGAFCIGLMGLWCGHANAWPASSSTWYVKTGSVIVDSSWVNIANTDVKPTLIQVTMIPHGLIVYYQNPGGNTGGVGVPFDLPLDITGVDRLIPTALSGRGKYTSSVEFFDKDILDRIKFLYPTILDDNAPNPNWIPYAVDVTSLDVYIQAFEDLSNVTYPCPDAPDASEYNQDLIPYNDTCYVTYYSDGHISGVGFEEEVVHIKGFCMLDGTTYNCTEDAHWEWSKKDQSYPYDY